MKTAHYVQIACTVVIAAAMQYAGYDPAHAALAHTVASAATALLSALGLATGSVGAPPVAPVAAPQLAPVAAS